MLDLDELVAACHAALDEPDPQLAVRDVLSRAVSRPGEVHAALPANRAGFTPLHVCDRLTISHVVWAPAMSVPPHDHRLWAAIAMYGGRESNVLYRRAQGTIVHAGDRLIDEGDVALMGHDAIHAVANPSSRSFAAGIHVYGGDFPGTERSIWDPENLEERQGDGTATMSLFDEANARLGL